jgi:hypothetical protein
MTAQEFATFLADEAKLNTMGYQDLKSLVAEYPFCQNLRLLLLKKSILDEHKDYDQNLKSAATFGIDRTHLFMVIKKGHTIAKPVEIKQEQILQKEEIFELTELSNIEKMLAEKHVSEVFGKEEAIEKSWKLDFNPPEITKSDYKLELPTAEDNPTLDFDYDLSDQPYREENKLPEIQQPFIVSNSSSKGELENQEPQKVHITDDIPQPAQTTKTKEDKSIDLDKLIESDKNRVNAPDLSTAQFVDADEYEEDNEEDSDGNDHKWDEPIYNTAPSKPPPVRTLDEIRAIAASAMNTSSNEEQKIIVLEPRSTFKMPESERFSMPKSNQNQQAQEKSTKDTPPSKKSNAFDEWGNREKTTNKEEIDKSNPDKKRKKKREMHELAAKSIKMTDDLVSETLADILAWQGNYDRAIDMYEKLSLVFPEKKSFFASKISVCKSDKKNKS